MKLIKIALVIFITALSLSVLIFTFAAIFSTKQTTTSLLWKQSVEQQLKERTEQYQTEIYDRYSRIERDISRYQRQTNKRLDYLEDRLKENSIIINNANNQLNQN